MTKHILRQWLHQDHVVVALMAMSVVGLLTLATFNIAFLSPVEQMIDNLKFTDLYTRVRNFHSQPDSSQFVTIVDMTDVYSRGQLAMLIDDIAQQGPRAIGVDVVFEGERDDIVGNQMLEQSVAAHRPLLVMATKLTGYDAKARAFSSQSRSYLTDHVDSISEAFVNLEGDMQHTVIRDYRSGMALSGQPQLVPSLPAALLQRFGINVSLRDKPMLINFANTIFPVVAWDSVAAHRQLIANRIVLLGAHRQESDMHITPMGKMSGVELHAYTTQTLMNQRHTADAPLWLNLLATFVACYLLAVFIEMSERRSQRNRPSALRIFLDESEWLKGSIVLAMAIVTTCLMHWIFEQTGLYINALLVLAAMAFVVQSHDTYMALINALAVRHPHNWWVRHSLAQDEA